MKVRAHRAFVPQCLSCKPKCKLWRINTQVIHAEFRIKPLASPLAILSQGFLMAFNKLSQAQNVPAAVNAALSLRRYLPAASILIRFQSLFRLRFLIKELKSQLPPFNFNTKF